MNSIRLSLKSPTESFYFEGDGEAVKIGRSHNCEFSVPKEDLSREHCLFEFTKEGFFITDLGSRNGVVVDRNKIISNKRTKVDSDSHILLANIYTLKINPSDFKSSKVAQDQKNSQHTTTFEFKDSPDTALGMFKKYLNSHEGRVESRELMKMIIGFIIILGFVIYQVLGR